MANKEEQLGVIHPEKGPFWRKMEKKSVSGGQKGEKAAMGSCRWSIIFGLLPLSSYLKFTSLLEKQRPERGADSTEVGLLMDFPNSRVQDQPGNLGGFMTICDRGPATATGYELEGSGMLRKPCLSPHSPLHSLAWGGVWLTKSVLGSIPGLRVAGPSAGGQGFHSSHTLRWPSLCRLCGARH